MKIATITGALLLVATAAGCCGDKEPSASSSDENPKRQGPVWTLVERSPSTSIYVFKDQDTGCEYLFASSGYILVPRIASDGMTHRGCSNPHSPAQYTSEGQ